MKRFALPFSLVSVIACSFVSSSLYAAIPAKTTQVKYHKQATVSSHKQLAAKRHHRAQYVQRSQPAYVAAPAVVVAAPVRQLNEFKLKPRVSFWALSGNYTLGKGQALFPLSGDQSHAFFALAEGDAVSNKTWFAGAGLGYRQIANNLLYGGYVIADCTSSLDSNRYWIINPGMEIFGNTWDFNANAYIAVNSKKKEFSTVRWADEFNIYTYIQHTEHKQYNRHAERTDFESVGQGVDFKVGRSIPGIDKAKAYVGGYYFKNKDAGSVTGGLAKITYDLNKYAALEVTDSYDGYNHNKVLLGVKLTLGGYSKQEQQDFGLSSRLMDTIDHGYSATIVPIKKVTGDIKIVGTGYELQKDNIWFFDPHGATPSGSNATYTGDGTFEHPFDQFNPETFKYVADHYAQIGAMMPALYIEGPTTISLDGFVGAPLPNSNGTNGLNLKLLVPSGWEIAGRMNNFQLPAQDQSRPVLLGGIDLWHDASGYGGNNILDSIVVHEILSTCRGVGILYMNNVKNVSLKNTTLGSEIIGTGNYPTSVWMNNSELNLSDSQIFAADNPTSVPLHAHQSFTANEDAGALGIYAANNSKVIFSGGNLVKAAVLGDTSNPGLIYQATGISIANNSEVSFVDGTNEVIGMTGSNQQQASSFYTYGAIADQNSRLIFSGGNNAVTASSTVSSPNPSYIWSYGISLANNSELRLQRGTNAINATNNIYQSLGGNNAEAHGIITDGSTIFFDNTTAKGNKNSVSATNTIDATNKTTYYFSAIGIDMEDTALPSKIYFNSGTNEVNATNSSYGALFATLYAIGINVDSFTVQQGSEVVFSGGTNSVSGKNLVVLDKAPSTVVPEVVGINIVSLSSLRFEDGRNSITAQNFVISSVSSANVYALLSSWGIYDNSYDANKVEFNNGENSVISENVASLQPENFFSGNALGMRVGGEHLQFNNGTNKIYAKNDLILPNGGGGQYILSGIGIYSEATSSVSFAGGKNLIDVTNTTSSDATPSYMTALGIQMGSNVGELVFTNGDNTINVSNHAKGADSSSIYGIYATSGTTVSFSNSKRVDMNISSSLSSTNQQIYGIYAEAGAILQDNSSGTLQPVTDLHSLLSYIKINPSFLVPPGAGSEEISGNGMTLDWGAALSGVSGVTPLSQNPEWQAGLMSKYDNLFYRLI